MEIPAQYLPWLVAGGLVILVLAIIAGRMLWLLRRQTRARKIDTAVQQQEVQEHGLAALHSIRILAASYLDGQVEACEVALRIAALQEHRDVSVACREQAAAFVELAAELAHIPSHGEWKALTREERDRFREEMSALEGRYHARLQQAAQLLRLH